MADETTAALQTGDTQQTTDTTTTTETTASSASAADTTDAAAKATAAQWPEDWRKHMAGDDEKELKQAERYASPKDIWKKARELERRLSSSEILRPLPENANPEQVAEYRSARGIPEKPEGYLENLPNGLVIGEDDKPIFESFVKELHAANADPKIAHAAVAWYNKFHEEQAAHAAEEDAQHRTETEDALRSEWGADFRANVNHVKAFLESAPKGVSERITNARDAEGRAILNDPEVMRWLVGMAREMNPAHTIVPGTSGNQTEALESEIEKIEKLMRTNRAEYNRDTKMQERLRNLYDARLKMQARGRAA